MFVVNADFCRSVFVIGLERSRVSADRQTDRQDRQGVRSMSHNSPGNLLYHLGFSTIRIHYKGKYPSRFYVPIVAS